MIHPKSEIKMYNKYTGQTEKAQIKPLLCPTHVLNKDGTYCI